MKLKLIAAVAENGVIGFQNNLPWNIPEDLREFMRITMGKHVLMGNNTYQSILTRCRARVLEGRENIVLSRKKFIPQGIDNLHFFHSLEEALNFSQDIGQEQVYVIGGQNVYEQTIGHPDADELIITRIHKNYEGDRHFPSIDQNIWKEISRNPQEGFSFVRYKKV